MFQMPRFWGPHGLPESSVFPDWRKRDELKESWSQEVAWQQEGDAGDVMTRGQSCSDEDEGQKGRAGLGGSVPSSSWKSPTWAERVGESRRAPPCQCGAAWHVPLWPL